MSMRATPVWCLRNNIWYAFDVFACVLAIYFLGFYYFPSFFPQSSLNGPMRFSHPVDTADR